MLSTQHLDRIGPLAYYRILTVAEKMATCLRPPRAAEVKRSWVPNIEAITYLLPERDFCPRRIPMVLKD